MTASNSDTSSLETLKHWAEIDWAQVKGSTLRLRRRIFQAKAKGDLRNLRCLQRLMLKSTSSILLSIREVSSNPGRNTPGIDMEKLDNFKLKLVLFYRIKRNGYMGKEPMPSKRIYIQEAKKKRPIGILTIYDRVIQIIVKNALEPEWEAIFEKGRQSIFG